MLRTIQYSELKHLSKQFTSEGVAAKDDGTVYFGYFKAGNLIGIVGVLTSKTDYKYSFRYKSDWVDPHFRGKGIYSELWEARELFVSDHFTETPQSIEFTAFCTPKSISKYLKEGFEIQGNNDRVVKYLKRKTMRQHETV